MKAKRLSEVRDLLALPEFQEWWRQLSSARQELATALHRRDELLAKAAAVEHRAELAQKSATDALERMGACEDRAAALRAEMADLDNRAFQLVSDYEEQRYDTSEAWYRLGALEREVEEKQAAVAAGGGKRAEEALETARHAAALQEQEYRRRDARKNELWAQVEQTWSRGVEVSMRHAEKKVQATRGRREAEALLALADKRRRRAGELRLRAQEHAAAVEAGRERLRALLARAEERFGCCAGDDFLYFRQRDDQRSVICISIVDDLESYNVQVKPLAVYLVERTRGVTELEVSRSSLGSKEQTDKGDSRFDEFFLAGRKGRNPSPRGT